MINACFPRHMCLLLDCMLFLVTPTFSCLVTQVHILSARDTLSLAWVCVASTEVEFVLHCIVLYKVLYHLLHNLCLTSSQFSYKHTSKIPCVKSLGLFWTALPAASVYMQPADMVYCCLAQIFQPGMTGWYSNHGLHLTITCSQEAKLVCYSVTQFHNLNI